MPLEREQVAQLARGDAARVVHERVVDKARRAHVGAPTVPLAVTGLEEEELREQPFLEGEMLELVLRFRLVGLSLERLHERDTALLVVQVQPERECLGEGHFLEKGARHVPRAELATALLLVHNGHVAQHHEPRVVDRTAITNELQVRLGERHDDAAQLLRHRELARVEHRPRCSVARHIQIPGRLPKNVVQFVVASMLALLDALVHGHVPGRDALALVEGFLA